ncbi:MAG: hypothetical protein ACO1O6_04165 [Bacteroidota bacterium]
MRTSIIFITLLALHFGSSAQLSCRKTSSDKENTTTCHHKTGAKSTVESWDKQGREGKITGYDKQGKELFCYSLRSFAGHASVYLSYHANGQVQKAEYSSAPDGGIQFYQEWYTFDENGVQTSFRKMDYPQELTSPFKEPAREDTVQKPRKQPEPEAFVPYETVFKIINTTRKRVILDITGNTNKWTELKSSEISCPADRETSIDTIVLSNHYLEAHEGYSVSLSGKNKKKARYRIISAQPGLSDGRKEYIWIIVRK